MRVILQVVKNAKCVIDNCIHSSIDKGFLLFVGFTEGDNEEIIRKMVEKILKLRIFLDENGKTNLSLKEVNGEILSISQFTLYADVKKGNRPSFISALKGEESSRLYDFFNSELKKSEFKISTGIFGADMKIELINDGPFTLFLDSKELFK